MDYKTIYDETTSKNAVWRGKTTKQFKEWKEIIQKGAKEAFEDWEKQITARDIEGFTFDIVDRMVDKYIDSRLYKDIMEELKTVAQDEDTFEEYRQSYYRVLEEMIQSELKEKMGITMPPRPAKWFSDEKYRTDDGRIVVATDEKPYYKVLAPKMTNKINKTNKISEGTFFIKDGKPFKKPSKKINKYKLTNGDKMRELRSDLRNIKKRINNSLDELAERIEELFIED